MDSSQWTQEYGVAKAAMGDVGGAGGQSACTRPASVMERKVNSRPQKDQVINCPRCQSTNTKFCYYNNYSLTQPRYFCKTCRRYWTEGGTLRNVPVGGGSRKNKRSSSSSSHVSPAASSNKLNLPDLNPPTINSHHFSSHHQNPKLIHDNDQGQDLNLGFQAPHQDYHHHHHGNIPQFLEFPKIIHNNRDLNSPNNNNNNNSSSATTSPLSALNFLRSGIGSYNPSTFIPMAPISNVDQANALFASGFPFQECKPSSLAFTFDAGNPNNHEQPENSNGTLMFTLGSAAAKQQHSSTSGDHDQEKGGHGNGNGYWNGMLGGGGGGSW